MTKFDGEDKVDLVNINEDDSDEAILEIRPDKDGNELLPVPEEWNIKQAVKDFTDTVDNKLLRITMDEEKMETTIVRTGKVTELRREEKETRVTIGLGR